MTDSVRSNLVDWIERNVGGEVLTLEREARWRPAWHVTVRQGDRTLALYVRGDRGHDFSYPLSYEAGILGVLESNGIPVPHVHGMCDEPKAIVMDFVPGGRQLTGVDDEEAQRRVIDEYVDILVAMHKIDVRQFEAAGLRNPSNPVDVQLNFHSDRRDTYRNHLKRRPEPFVEFVLGWMERNVPRHRFQKSFVTFDAGQFLVDNGHVSALYDFEISHIGDPLADLGGLRCRNAMEPLGDLGYLFRRYEEKSGEELDLDVINFHTMVLALAANEAIAKLLTEPIPEAITYRTWEVSGARITLSAMADIMGIQLDPIDPPVESPNPFATAAESMVSAVEALHVLDADRYQKVLAGDLARHLHLASMFGAGIAEENADDVASVLGRPIPPGEDPDLELERFVQSASPDMDGTLLQLFHRRVERQKMLLPEFDPSTAAPGDVGPYLDRCRLPRLSALLGRGESKDRPPPDGRGRGVEHD